MRAVDIVVPGSIESLTGGYIYDKRIAEGLASLGWSTRIHSLDPSFPVPTRTALKAARNVFDDIPDQHVVVVDGLALGGLAEILSAHAERLSIVALVHHPVAFELSLYAARAKSLHQAERESLSLVRRVVCTSAWTSRALAEYDVAPELIRIVEPGTDAVPAARGSGESVLNLLCVATVIPRKGHAVLLDALERLRHRAWHLHCVGSLERDRACVSALRAQIDALRLGERITLHGEVSDADRDRLYEVCDIFVLPSNLEGYGMALAEALAHGIPIVTTSAGAIRETVPEGVGLFVPPGECSMLASALDTLIGDSRARKRFAERALAARSRLPSWEEASIRFGRVLSELATA